MDAVKFVKTLGRMCNAECIRCEFWKRKSGGESCTSWQKTHPEEAVAIVEKWAAEHPIKTRQSVFLEQYPEAKILKDGAIVICPLAVSAAYREKREKDGSCASLRYGACDECRKAFWLAEVEDV